LEVYGGSILHCTTRTVIHCPPRGVAGVLNICRSTAILCPAPDRRDTLAMTESNNSPPADMAIPGQAQRVPIEQEMELKFPNFELLVTAMSANISTTGMFIQSPEPAPVGTTLSFRFRIEDWSPIQGTVRVIWNRELVEGTDRPTGIGVKFVDLDAQSRRMIRYLVDKHLEKGGEPFELGHEIESPSAPSAEAPPASAGSSEPRPQSHRLLWGVGAGLMVGVVGIGLWFQLTRPPITDDEHPAAMVTGEHTGVASPVPVSPASEPPDSAAAVGNWQAEEAIQSLVRDWSTAWESRQADTLLEFYAPDFEPAGRQARAQWEAGVRREMSNASFIRVAISALEISAPTASEGRASFYQSIRSDQRDETVRTSLEVVRLNDEWKIVRQTINR